MKEISCEIKLMIGGEDKSVEEILKQVISEEKFELYYGDTLKHYSLKEGKNQKEHTILESKDEIDGSIKNGGVYFIFSYENDKLLYIGKSQNLKYRLKQHLIKCCLSTGSHIKDLIDYLKARELARNRLAIKYCVINTEHNKDNATIEGAFIDYVLKHKSEPLFDKCWNCRQD